MRKRLIMRKTFLFMFASFLIFVEKASADLCWPGTGFIHSHWELFSSNKWGEIREIKDGDILKGTPGDFDRRYKAYLHLTTEPRLVGCKIESGFLILGGYRAELAPNDEDTRDLEIYNLNDFILYSGGEYSCHAGVKLAPYKEKPPYSEGIKTLETKPKKFYVDLTPPSLSINSPADGTVVKAGTEGFQIDVTANDDVGVKDFTIKVDGIVRDTINARDKFKPDLKQWLRTKVYGTGRRFITVVAKDEVERTAERSFFVYSDDAPPTISNVWPQPAPLDDPHRVSLRTSQSMVAIRANIVDRGMAGIKEVRLLDEMGRILVTRNRPYEGNTYILDYTRPAGARNIVCYIQAFDKVGNMSLTNMITIIWEEAPPAPPGGGIKKEPIKPIIPKQPAIKPTVK